MCFAISYFANLINLLLWEEKHICYYFSKFILSIFHYYFNQWKFPESYPFFLFISYRYFIFIP